MKEELLRPRPLGWMRKAAKEICSQPSCPEGVEADEANFAAIIAKHCPDTRVALSASVPDVGDAEAKEKLFRLIVDEYCNVGEAVMSDDELRGHISAAIASAVAAERERCAEILRQMAEKARHSFPGSEEQRVHAYAWLHDAKLAIRSPAPAQDARDWVVVPREPTEAMLVVLAMGTEHPADWEAGKKAQRHRDDIPPQYEMEAAYGQYQRLIAAAHPQEPVRGGGE